MKSDPFVLCLTNTVAANFTANVLLAIGAKPAMIEEPSEAAELAAVADAVLVNVGTLTPAQAEVMRAAVAVLAGPVPTDSAGSVPTNAGSVPMPSGSVPTGLAGSVPWVLDPVGVQFLSYRRKFVLELIQQKPTLIRGNHAEIEFLAGSVPNLKGSVPILSTGEVDRIWGGDPQPIEITGGAAILQQVTATGCAQGSVCAALLGRGLSPVETAIQASKLMKRAGERAFAKAQTPGSFQMALIDALSELAPSLPLA